MPSADWEAWNALTAKGKALRLIKYCAWSGAFCTKYLPRRLGKKGKMMAADFHWELAPDCPFWLTQARWMHAQARTPAVNPGMSLPWAVPTWLPLQGFPALSAEDTQGWWCGTREVLNPS